MLYLSKQNLKLLELKEFLIFHRVFHLCNKFQKKFFN